MFSATYYPKDFLATVNECQNSLEVSWTATDSGSIISETASVENLADQSVQNQDENPAEFTSLTRNTKYNVKVCIIILIIICIFVRHKLKLAACDSAKKCSHDSKGPHYM